MVEVLLEAIMNELEKYIEDRTKWEPNHPVYLHEVLTLARALHTELQSLRERVEALESSNRKYLKPTLDDALSNFWVAPLILQRRKHNPCLPKQKLKGYKN